MTVLYVLNSLFLHYKTMPVLCYAWHVSFFWLFQAMVTRYSSISTRKLSKALKILTSDKCMVATSDYNEFHKTVKRHILANVLGANAQVNWFLHLFHPPIYVFAEPV